MVISLLARASEFNSPLMCYSQSGAVDHDSDNCRRRAPRPLLSAFITRLRFSRELNIVTCGMPCAIMVIDSDLPKACDGGFVLLRGFVSVGYGYAEIAQKCIAD